MNTNSLYVLFIFRCIFMFVIAFSKLLCYCYLTGFPINSFEFCFWIDSFSLSLSLSCSFSHQAYSSRHFDLSYFWCQAIAYRNKRICRVICIFERKKTSQKVQILGRFISMFTSSRFEMGCVR